MADAYHMVTEGDRTYLLPTDPAAARTALSEALAGAERQLTGVHRYDEVGIAIREEQGRLSHLLLTIERGAPHPRPRGRAMAARYCGADSAHRGAARDRTGGPTPGGGVPWACPRASDGTTRRGGLAALGAGPHSLRTCGARRSPTWVSG